MYKAVDEQGNVACNFVDKVDVRREGFANKAAGSIEGGKGVEIAQKRPEEEWAASAASAGEGEASAASSSNDASAQQEAPSTVIVVGLALVAAAVIFLQLNPGE